MATLLLTSPELLVGTAADVSSDGYTHVLAVTTAAPDGEPPPGQVRLHLPLSDEPAADLLQHWDAAVSFVHAAAASSGDSPPRLLVHCQHGVSRSAATAIAVLAALGGLSVDDAAALVHALRPAVQPNAGFLTQLRLAGQMLQLGMAPPPPPSPLAGLAPAPTARLLRAASRRVAAGMPCDGFDVAAGGLFVCADAWPPHRLGDAELATLRRVAEAGVAQAAVAPAAAAAPSLLAALYPQQEQQHHQGSAASGVIYYCCGRCNARLCTSANVLWDGRAAVTVGAGDASTATAGEAVVILEPLTWMAFPGGASATATSVGVDGGGSGSRARSYGRPPATDHELDALVLDALSAEGKLHCPAPRCGAKLGSYAWRARWSRSPAERDGGDTLPPVTSPLFWIPASRLIKRRAT